MRVAHAQVVAEEVELQVAAARKTLEAAHRAAIASLEEESWRPVAALPVVPSLSAAAAATTATKTEQLESEHAALLDEMAALRRSEGESLAQSERTARDRLTEAQEEMERRVAEVVTEARAELAGEMEGVAELAARQQHEAEDQVCVGRRGVSCCVAFLVWCGVVWCGVVWCGTRRNMWYQACGRSWLTNSCKRMRKRTRNTRHARG